MAARIATGRPQGVSGGREGLKALGVGGGDQLISEVVHVERRGDAGFPAARIVNADDGMR